MGHMLLRRRFRGIALIMALLVLTLLVVIVGQLAYSTRIDLQVTRNASDSQAALLAAWGGVEFSKGVLRDDEYAEIRDVARRARLSVSEWVRQALRAARREVPSAGADRKLQAVRAAAAYTFPTADMDQMLREVEAGYGGDEQA